MNEDEVKNLEFLVGKSRSLLQEQLKSFENCSNKSGILISASALFVPIAITFLTSSGLDTYSKIIALLSVLMILIAISFFLKLINPKVLNHGFNFDQFGTKVDGSYNELLDYEISANKLSYENNEKIVLDQWANLIRGIKLIFVSIIILLISASSLLF